METYLHSFYTWALAKHGLKAGRAAGIAGAVGGAFADLPSFLGTAYYVGPRFLGHGWCPTDSKEVLEKIYFTGPFGTTGSRLHSAALPLASLTLYGLLGRRKSAGRKVVLWFLVGWLGHTLVDFLTHVHDVRPLFWPVTGRTWSSPVSYYDPRYHGREFALASNGLALALALALLTRRLRRQRSQADS